jgi:GT2 family glycosyltransferase
MICTRNRATAVKSALDATAKSMHHAAPATIELVISNNNSTDDTHDVLTAWKAENADLTVKILDEKKPGLSHARNTGLDNVKGDIIIFTDDDCMMELDYISEALEYAKNDPHPVIRGGRIELYDKRDLEITVRTVDEVETWTIENRSVRYKKIRGAVSGCNMCVPKTIIDKIGKFDTNIGAGTNIPGSEDTDFVLRSYLQGYAIQYVPNMITHHNHGRRTPEDGNKIMQNYSIGAGAMYIKYMFKCPDYCRYFVWDLRNALKEIRHNKNDFMPDINFSSRDIIKGNIKGALRYIFKK